MAKISKNKANWLTDALDNLGLNKSTVREQVCREIYLQKGIFSANQIIERTGLGKVSVYRNLELLEKLDLIRPAITIRGQRFYEKNNDENHHHIICTECLKTSCIDCTEPKISAQGGSALGGKYQNINHLLIFTGVCNTCAK